MRVVALLSALLFLAACPAAPVREEAPRSTTNPSEKPYFDAALAEKLTLGTSTRKDVLSVMGPPYPDDPRKETGRLVYRHTDTTQLVFEFSEDVLKAKLWGDIYGIHKGQ